MKPEDNFAIPQEHAGIARARRRETACNVTRKWNEHTKSTRFWDGFTRQQKYPQVILFQTFWLFPSV